jgi:hypothetical protein
MNKMMKKYVKVRIKIGKESRREREDYSKSRRI